MSQLGVLRDVVEMEMKGVEGREGKGRRKEERSRTCSPESLTKTGDPLRRTSVKAGRRMSRYRP